MEEQDDIKPILGDKGKQNPFIVPEGYFENFSSRLNERMEPVVGRSRRKILRPAFIYSAAFVAILVVAVSIVRLSQPHQPAPGTAESQMANLIQYSLDNIDEQTLIDACKKSDPDSTSSDITREDILNYLQDQNIDPTSITDAL